MILFLYQNQHTCWATWWAAAGMQASGAGRLQQPLLQPAGWLAASAAVQASWGAYPVFCRLLERRPRDRLPPLFLTALVAALAAASAVAALCAWHALPLRWRAAMRGVHLQGLHSGGSRGSETSAAPACTLAHAAAGLQSADDPEAADIEKMHGRGRQPAALCSRRQRPLPLLLLLACCLAGLAICNVVAAGLLAAHWTQLALLAAPVAVPLLAKGVYGDVLPPR